MRFLFIFFTGFLFSSCTGSTPAEFTQENKDSLKAPVTGSKGIQGIFAIPEILTLAIKDTATAENISAKIENAYKAIEEDIKTLGIQNTGNQGLLFYTNDPKNFVFECVIPIKEIPKEKPKNSTIVILESTNAVVYNYYGPYDQMNVAYDELKKYISENKLQQTSASREFYITDPLQEKDTAKWLSKIYIPVK